MPTWDSILGFTRKEKSDVDEKICLTGICRATLCVDIQGILAGIRFFLASRGQIRLETIRGPLYVSFVLDLYPTR